MPQSQSPSKKTQLGISRHIIRFPQQEQEQKLSYQTNKLAQYIELQLSDLQNTLHYIQKKHSINQIKQSISHSYNIFAQTEPIFRQLRINFVYQKIKKLVNCFSIIYLILMQHLEKPSRFTMQSQNPKPFDTQIQNTVVYQETVISRKNTYLEKKSTINHFSQTTQYGQTTINGVKKPKPLGGIHLYNEQYNRHIQSDLDRLKRKLKQQAKQAQQGNNPKQSEKQRLKEQIFKQINSDIYGSPSPDELTLFFNLNSNRYGSQLQYITFQDQLQEIAAFFKQSQDEALQFLNKSRDDFIYFNFNQGFKQTIAQYKIQKQEQVNGFVSKVKNLFQAIKGKTLEKQHQLNKQIQQLKRLQQSLTKPQSYEIQTQTSYNFEDQISRLRKKLQQVEANYNALHDFHKNQNQNEEKTITFLQHKLAFKDHEISILKKQLQEKSHFINYLNDKINGGTDVKVLRKISNIYRNHTKKNSNKLKIQLEQLEKQGSIDINTFNKNNSSLKNNDNDPTRKDQKQKTQISEDSDEAEPKRSDKKNFSSPLQDYEKPNKRKRKPGISFVATPEKRFASYMQRNASFNFPNSKIQEVNSQMQKATSQDIPMYEEPLEQKRQSQTPEDQNELKKQKSKKNLVKHDKRKSQDRNSLQIVQKRNSKLYEPKRSAFASGISNTKFIANDNKSQRSSKRDSLNQNISEESAQNISDEEQLMRELNKMPNNTYYNQETQEYENIEGNQNQVYPNDQSIEGNTESYNDSQESQIQVEEQKIENQNRISNDNISSDQKTSPSKQVNPNGKQKYIERKKLSDQVSQAGSQALKPKTNISKQKQQSKYTPNSRGSQNTQNGMKKSTGSKLGVKKAYSNQVEIKNKPNVVPGRFVSFQNKEGNTLNAPVMTNSSDQSDQKVSEFNKNNDAAQIQEQSKQLLNKDQCQQVIEADISSQEMQDKLLATISGFSTLQGFNKKQKQQLISNFFTTIYKEQKIKKSTLNSCMIDISIQSQLPKQVPQNQDQRKSKKDVLLSVSNKQFVTEINRLSCVNSRTPTSKQDDFSIKHKSKNSLGFSSDMKLQPKGKLSQLTIPESMLKFRQNKTLSQNLIDNLTTFKEIAITKQLKQEQDDTQRQNKDEEKDQNNRNERKSTLNEKKLSMQGDFQRIYGINTVSGRNLQQNSFSNLFSQYDKQKVQEYLQKAAMKAAIKSKNIQEFKAKIKKMHMPKCGQTCRHLERYLQNFSKYKSNNREIMKIHIQNVNHTIHEQDVLKSNKENSVVLPSINLMNTTGFSSKGFLSVQRPQGTGPKK